MRQFDAERNEKALSELSNEWESVLDLIREARGQRRAALVQGWEELFQVLLWEQQEIAAAGQWSRGPWDLLSIIDRGRWETYHSAILAWLLDPLAPHGLGVCFLANFLQAANPQGWADDLQALHVFSVEREVTRGECRADIVVHAATFTLVVENKIDAIESERQCDRIYEAFSDDTGARFVLLTPRGSVPQSACGAAANEFKTLSYREIKDALARALEATSARERASGRSSAISYLHTLEREFP